jgi:Ser-tRNA(Ala) deacylase AlaX
MTHLTLQDDARRRTLVARVLACEPIADGAFHVVLADTVLYPEGGGQPSDAGTVAGVPVRDVRREPDGRVVHVLPEPLAPGAEVEVVVDWARRFDHMQQHTAQHLLTALAQDRFGWPTTAFHLGPERCDIDLDVAALADADLAALEEAANAEVRAARRVSHSWVTVPELARKRVRSRGLPEGFGGPVRLVSIAGLDLNTCGGTHVASTAEIQVIALLGTERVHRQTRLHWLAGDRVRRALAAAGARERALAKTLSVAPEAQPAAVERLLDEQRAARAERRRLLGELATLAGRALVAEPGPVATWHAPDADLALLNAVAGAAQAGRPDSLFLLTGGDAGGEGVFLLAGPPERVAALGPAVAEGFGGRGGGAKGRYQGRAPRLAQLAEVLARLGGTSPYSGSGGSCTVPGSGGGVPPRTASASAASTSAKVSVLPS